MNKFQSLLLPLLAVLAFTFTACGEDDTPIIPVAPTVSAISGAGLVTAVDTVAPLEEFTVRLSATSGNSNMLSITVTEDGTTIDDLSRIKFDGVAGAANPILLFDADTAGFTKDITITAHGFFSETRIYAINVRDANGEISSVSVDIRTEDTVAAPLTTPLDTTYTGKIFANASGPDLDGGMDLSTGIAVSVNSAMANIVDAGIDLALPAASNWIQKIEPANGALLTVPAAGFDYDAATNKEAITDGYNLSTEVTTTDKVQIGDVFFVQTVEATYVFKVTNIVVTPNNNRDNYTIEIKF